MQFGFYKYISFIMGYGIKKTAQKSVFGEIKIMIAWYENHFVIFVISCRFAVNKTTMYVCS